MGSIDQFRVYFESELLPQLEELNVEKKGITQKARKLIYIGLVVAAVPIILTLTGALPFSAIFIGIIAVTFILGLIYYFVYHPKYTNLTQVYKNLVMKQMVHFLSPNLSYSEPEKISESEYQSSKIFLKEYERYNGDDLVQGKLGKTNLKFSELKTEYYTRDKDGNKTWHTIFHGIFAIADFHKEFKGETFVLPDRTERLLGRLGKMFQRAVWSRPGLITLENPVFEKQFKVYTTDDVEARYILSPKLMDDILQFQKKCGVSISLSFIQSKVYMAIPLGRNLFEPSFWGNLTDFDQVKAYFEDMNIAISIVEDLDLNTRIWTKD